MKRILKLIASELKQLKKTVILTALIFTIFAAALFGVINVRSDLMRNLCDYLNNEYKSFNLTINDGFTMGEAKLDFGNRLIYGYNRKYTDTGIHNADGSICFDREQTFTGEDGKEHFRHYSGQVLYVNDLSVKEMKTFEGFLTEGTVLQNDFEICLCSFIAEKLEVSAGETVTISGKSFTVAGVYEVPEISGISYPNWFSTDYMLSLSDDAEMDSVIVYFDNAEEMLSAYTTAKGKKLDCYCEGDSYFDNITEMQIAFTAFAVLLAIVLIITIYSLVSMLFRQRKQQICRLKVLGATDGTVAGAYCGITIIFLFFAIAVASALGLLFNLYFMDLCESIFEFPFTAKFGYIAPIVTFIASIGVVFALWFIINRKTKSNALAKELRHE
ncbi:MAG: ABC transporter permease [Clostridia bacterium]|nr:ABC transporter permease [Clostridia bacterium]